MRAHDVVFAALALAWKGALTTIGIAILLGMLLPGEASPPAVAKAPGSLRALVQDDGDKVLITMGIVEGDVATTFILRDGGGKELVQVHYHKNGNLVFGSAEDSPVRVIVAPSRSGAVAWGLHHGRVVLGLEARPDGSTAVDVCSPGPVLLDRLEVTPEGRPVHTFSGPPVVAPTPD